MNWRFSGGGGESDWLCDEFFTWWLLESNGPDEEEVDDEVDVSVRWALAAVRLIPLLVQGTAAECIIAKRS